MIKGNWQRQAGSLVTYQCGEAAGEMSEPEMWAAHPNNLQQINNGKADFMGRRLLEDTNRRLRAFREKGGGRYPEDEMLEQFM